ncbi:MAG: hypothetical protein AB7P52_18320 [Alphaproteobacteria bacterium]
MLGTDDFEEDTGTVFRDTITLALAGFVAMVVLVLPHIHPKAESQAASVEPPGSVIVEVRWPDPIDADIDLWVAAPGETPVGYSNKGGRTFNLLRDDRGHYNDPTELNYEVSFSRGVPAGEYVVNLHYYGLVDAAAQQSHEVPATVVVSTRSPTTGTTMRRFAENLVLSRIGEETTALRFSMNDRGEVMPGSLNHLFKPLREGEKSW